MKEKNLFCNNYRPSPSFDIAKHRLLCLELKQLYVAITRTKQELWILETAEGDGTSQQICEYWKTMKLVEVQRFDPSLFKDAHASSSSTVHDWMSTGFKVLRSIKLLFGFSLNYIEFSCADKFN